MGGTWTQDQKPPLLLGFPRTGASGPWPGEVMGLREETSQIRCAPGPPKTLGRARASLTPSQRALEGHTAQNSGFLHDRVGKPGAHAGPREMLPASALGLGQRDRCREALTHTPEDQAGPEELGAPMLSLSTFPREDRHSSEETCREPRAAMGGSTHCPLAQPGPPGPRLSKAELS